MRIVLTAPIEEPVPPLKYGGTELVVANLAEEMVKRGHEVFLLAAGDSRTSAKLVPLVTQSLRQQYTIDEIDRWRDVLKINQLATVLKEIKKLQPDIIFNHQGWRFVPFVDLVECPVYTTVHGELQSDSEQLTYQQFPRTPLISISNNQRKAMPKLNWVKTIYNGIDTDQYAIGTQKRDHFVFLGRTSPEKGLKEICQMIKKTKHTLQVAAKVDTNDQYYFEQEIRPLIDGQQISFIGEIGPHEKATFLQKAKGLLLWLNWEEPFGLVVVEAMANGTPVIVNKRGAMPELVADGKTGFLVNSIDDMQQYLDKVDTLNPEACRQHVITHFSATRMAHEYLELAGKEKN